MFRKRKAVIVQDEPPEAVEPQTVERTIYVEDKRPRFMLGLILGVLLLAAGIAFFATHEGSYETAGASVDRSIDAAADNAQQAAHRAAATIESRTE